MAEAAENREICDEPRVLGRVVPMKSTGGASGNATDQPLVERSPSQSSRVERLDEGKQRANDTPLCTKQAVGDLYRKVREGAADAYLDISSASRDLIRRLRRRGEQIKEEHPLQLLAVIAGTALVLGIAARVWRSRHHA